MKLIKLRKGRTLLKDALLAFIAWIISMILLLAIGAEGEILLGWGLIMLTAIPLYSYSFYRLLPRIPIRNYSFLWYWVRMGILIGVATLLVAFLLFPITSDTELAIGYAIINALFHFFITAPFTWLSFYRYTKRQEEKHELEKELGQSHASLDFLRSQINPHFLFNVLNTIYGTAIQEKAERTSEALEQLGEMMRFMLHENAQEQIPLSREIDYLTNYIALQRLRTDPTLTIQVQSEIASQATSLPIAPMLLIPFIENAFKHGISLREPSYIVISVTVNASTLLLEVRNSKHSKTQNDPEEFKSGIGLTNVRQRLQLLYPNRHKLIIQETGNEFFIHLTIQLV